MTKKSCRITNRPVQVKLSPLDSLFLVICFLCQANRPRDGSSRYINMKMTNVSCCYDEQWTNRRAGISWYIDQHDCSWTDIIYSRNWVCSALSSNDIKRWIGRNECQHDYQQNQFQRQYRQQWGGIRKYAVNRNGDRRNGICRCFHRFFSDGRCWHYSQRLQV